MGLEPEVLLQAIQTTTLYIVECPSGRSRSCRIIREKREKSPPANEAAFRTAESFSLTSFAQIQHLSGEFVALSSMTKEVPI